MPRSEFGRDMVVTASPAECWAALTDVPRLVGWVSVVEDAEEVEPLAAYTAVLMDRLGPFRLRADLDIRLSDVVPGESLHVRATGEDRQVGSRLAVNADLSVQAREGGATIGIRGMYEVTGKVASMGSGTITKKAEKIMNEFFDAASAALGSP